VAGTAHCESPHQTYQSLKKKKKKGNDCVGTQTLQYIPEKENEHCREIQNNDLGRYASGLCISLLLNLKMLSHIKYLTNDYIMNIFTMSLFFKI
jgi:hypothetical protein